MRGSLAVDLISILKELIIWGEACKVKIIDYSKIHRGRGLIEMACVLVVDLILV